VKESKPVVASVKFEIVVRQGSNPHLQNLPNGKRRVPVLDFRSGSWASFMSSGLGH
jgi:hypothetical protein